MPRHFLPWTCTRTMLDKGNDGRDKADKGARRRRVKRLATANLGKPSCQIGSPRTPAVTEDFPHAANAEIVQLRHGKMHQRLHPSSKFLRREPQLFLHTANRGWKRADKDYMGV